jgi:hypothetical protein
MEDEASDANGKFGMSRRKFLKLVGVTGAIAAFIPLIDWGKFVPSPSTAKAERQEVILPDETQVNSKRHPVTRPEVSISPLTGDRVVVRDPLRTSQHIIGWV